MLHEIYELHEIVNIWFQITFANFFFFKVGAGSAGCVLANRLSEDPESSVLLIEAGGSEDDNSNISIPIASGLLQKTEQDWKYKTVPQKKACLALHEKVFIHSIDCLK